MTSAEFSADPVQPWHAIFVGSTEQFATLYSTADSYGKHILSMGLAINYKIIGNVKDNKAFIHCIPYDGKNNMIDYWKKIVELGENLQCRYNDHSQSTT